MEAICWKKNNSSEILRAGIMPDKFYPAYMFLPSIKSSLLITD
jgi:hypothetical protein